MKLVIFDIDGTVVDSVNADDRCFLEAISQVFNLELVDVDWNSFPHVTDEGLTWEIVRRHLQRNPTAVEVQEMKAQFSKLIANEAHAFSEIRGAVDFVAQLQADAAYEVGFATGGWKETAMIKLSAVGIDPKKYVLKSSSDFMEREQIVTAAVGACQDLNPGTKFRSISYFGDGIWDLRTTKKLGHQFFGIDAKGSRLLENAGAKKVIRDFSQTSTLISCL